MTTNGKGVIMSSKFIEIHFKDGKPIRTGDQFGSGRAKSKAIKTATAEKTGGTGPIAGVTVGTQLVHRPTGVSQDSATLNRQSRQQ